MRDNLEKFIHENREEFDSHEPGDGLWDKIEKKLKPHKTINWRMIAGRAAAVILIFAASYMVNRYLDERGRITDRIKSKKEKPVIIPELKEAEIYYSGLINEKLQEIKPMLADNPVLEKEINIDLSQLDSIYDDLKQDLRDNISNQEVIEAMIQNYRLRLSILEDVLSELKPEENEPNTKYDSYDM